MYVNIHRHRARAEHITQHPIKISGRNRPENHLATLTASAHAALSTATRTHARASSTTCCRFAHRRHRLLHTSDRTSHVSSITTYACIAHTTSHISLAFPQMLIAITRHSIPKCSIFPILRITSLLVPAGAPRITPYHIFLRPPPVCISSMHRP